MMALGDYLSDVIGSWATFYMRHKVYYGAPDWPSYCVWIVNPKEDYHAN